MAALLLAEACDVGLTPVIKPNEAALTRARLAHVDQYYLLRADNHAAANAVLIGAQAQIPIAQAWGGGLLASVDGLRFVVPVRTLNAGPSPKYFGDKRGITWLNAANDQVARHRTNGGAWHAARLALHSGHDPEPRRRPETGDGDR